MSSCKTCKYWNKAGQWETGNSFGLGRCGNIPLFYDAADWSDDGEERIIIEKFKDCKAFAQDGSDYDAYLLTKEDFGCVSYLALGS